MKSFMKYLVWGIGAAAGLFVLWLIFYICKFLYELSQISIFF